jgi:hypothetical protein
MTRKIHYLLIPVLSLVLAMPFGIPPVAAQPQTRPVCDPIPAGLVSWWSGDGTANDIQNLNNGTLQNGATFASGKVGQAFSFDGVDDNVVVPDAPSLNPVNAVTLDAWVYYTGQQNVDAYILNKDDEVFNRQ